MCTDKFVRFIQRKIRQLDVTNYRKSLHNWNIQVIVGIYPFAYEEKTHVFDF